MQAEVWQKGLRKEMYDKNLLNFDFRIDKNASPKQPTSLEFAPKPQIWQSGAQSAMRISNEVSAQKNGQFGI